MTDAVETWCLRMDTLAFKVGQGDYAAVTRLADLSDEAIALARTLPPERRTRILDRLRRAVSVINEAHADVGRQLEELPAKRRAARRYVATPQVRVRP